MKILTPADFSKIKRMNMSELGGWLARFYAIAYEDGQQAASSEVPCIQIYDDELKEIMMSVKGIGERRAEEVMKKLEDKWRDK